MKKNETVPCLLKRSMVKILLRMKLLSFLLLATFAVSAANSYSQQTRFSFELNNTSVEKVFQYIEDNSEFILLYNEKYIDVDRKISVDVKDETVETILDQVLDGSGNLFKIYDRQIVILENENSEIPSIIQDSPILQQPKREVKGVISDENGEGLPGVNILIKGTTKGTTSDMNGNYSLNVSDGDVLVVSFIGYKSVEIAVGEESTINIKMEQDVSEIGDITVKGYRASLQRAVAIKRESPQFVDAISAEDVGKLPDQNIAEALQRVTGVAIERTRGQGDFVSIRGLGPDFVRGSINGRSLVSATEFFDQNIGGATRVSTGRAANFDVLPSEIINTLEVVKSTSAKHVEGGIGGVVNVKTSRPLSVGEKFSASAQASYQDFAGNLDPILSGLYSHVNDAGTLGVLFSASYSKRSIREDFSRGFGWFQFGSYDTDNDGLVNDGVSDDLSNVYIPLSHHYESFEEKRERFTVTNTWQFKPGDNTDINFDFIYSKRKLENTGQEALLITLPLFDQDWASAGINQNPDGSAQVQGIYDGNTLTSIPFSLAPEIVMDRNTGDDDLFSFGLNLKQKIASWDLNADASYVAATGKLDFDRAVIVGDGGSPSAGGVYAFQTDISRSGFVTVDKGSTASLAAPDNYWIRNGTFRDFDNKDSEMALQLDAKREIGGIISSIEMGLRARKRNKEVMVSFFDNHFRVDADGTVFGFEEAGGQNYRGRDNFYNGDLPGINFSEFIFPKIDPYYEFLNSQTLYDRNGTIITTDLVFDPLNSFKVTESTLSSYVQANLKGEIGDVPFSGDLGFRMVYTDQDISGYVRPFTISGAAIVFTSPDNEEINFNSSYLNVLPSLNLSFDLEEDLILRVAASKSLTRPTFNDLAPALSINPNATIDLNEDGVAATATGGNPKLKPYESTNFDLGLEWYLGGGSALYGSFFYKKLDNYIASVTNEDVELEGVVFDRFSQPDNQGTAEVGGFEIGYQKSFRSGLGYAANATFVENSAEFVQGGGSIDFPGVSKFSYNVTGYYDNGKFQVRLTYSHRDEFLSQPSPSFGEPLWVDAYGQLDGSISYNINDNISLFGNAVNILNSNPEMFSRSEALGSDRFYSTSHFGRKLSLGLKVNF